MRQKIILFLSLSLISGLFSLVSAQTPDNSMRPTVLVGDVTSLTENKIVLQTKDGAVDVALSGKTEFKRVPPDNPSLKAATASTFQEIAVGDRLAVSGILSTDKKNLPAKSVYLMTKSDIAQKQTKESEQWRTRGVSGKVVSVNPQNNQITIEVRGLANSSNVVLTPKENAKFRRYAPNSVKYSESKASSVSEIKPGDMLRALGDKSADGAAFAAEEVLTGAFQTVAGTVKTIDAAKGEVVITDFQTKKDVTIVVGASSTLKKFPEEMAQRMAMMQTAGGVRPAGQGQNAAGGGMRPAQTGNPQGGENRNQGGQAGRGGFGGNGNRGGGQGGIDDMLERFPNITVADLKPGDVIAVSSTKSADATKLTAIKLLAGVEPFLKTAQAAAGNGGGQRGQGGQNSLNIPGLDGVDFP